MRLKLQRLLAAAVIALAAISVVDHLPILLAQSTRVAGRDVPVTPFEQWFKRLGLLNTNTGCDVALEYDSLGVARITDCTDTANLRDVKARGLFLNGGSGDANSDRYKVYRIDAIADATATDVFTVTVPNAAHAAVIPVIIMAGLGAGGAVGDWECAGTAYGQLVIERFAAAATVKTATTLSNTGSSCTAGATTIATAYDTSGLTGANGATQTFTVRVTVTKGGGASANHHAVVQADILNALAGGITIS